MSDMSFESGRAHFHGDVRSDLGVSHGRVGLRSQGFLCCDFIVASGLHPLHHPNVSPTSAQRQPNVSPIRHPKTGLGLYILLYGVCLLI
jgi:hypothetical protein